MRKAMVLGLAALSLMCAQAQAKPAQSTKYKFYNITGDTPVEIYSAMIKRGPAVNGVNAYASTQFSWLPTGNLVDDGELCRITDYKLVTEFTINLPKLKNEKRLKRRVALKWVEFKAFLQDHEEQHTTIWLDCARELEIKVAELQMPKCAKLEREVEVLFQSMRTTCDKKHAAFDTAERKRLMKHPFVRMVLGQRMQSTKALKAN